MGYVSGKASEPPEKEFYARLADWERNHARYREDFYNYYQETGLRTDGDSGL